MSEPKSKRLPRRAKKDSHAKPDLPLAVLDGGDGKTATTALDERFAEFAADLRQHFVARITPYTVLKEATRERRSVADHVDQSLDKALDNLNILKTNLDKEKVIAISFGQCLRDTVEAVLRARKQGVPTFGITDSNTSPIARHCDAHLIAPVVSPSFLNSYVAPMAAISAVHVACAHIDPNRSLSRLRPTDREYASGHRWYREPKGSNGNEPQD